MLFYLFGFSFKHVVSLCWMKCIYLVYLKIKSAPFLFKGHFQAKVTNVLYRDKKILKIT